MPARPRLAAQSRVTGLQVDADGKAGIIRRTVLRADARRVGLRPRLGALRRFGPRRHLRQFARPALRLLSKRRADERSVIRRRIMSGSAHRIRSRITADYAALIRPTVRVTPPASAAPPP